MPERNTAARAAAENTKTSTKYTYDEPFVIATHNQLSPKVLETYGGLDH